MKLSQTQHRRWLYVGLALMLLALVSFSLIPLVSSIVQARQSQTQGANISSVTSANLETQALGYQLILEREPDNQNALRGLLEIKLKQSDLAGAISPLERLAQLNPQVADYGILLAQAKQQLGDDEGAAAAYRAILAAQPGEMRALKGMVELLLAQNRSTEAISLVQKSLTEAIAGQPPATPYSLTSLQLLLGEIFFKQNRYSEAITIYDRALKAAPQDFRPLFAKALVLREQGKESESQTLFKESLLLAPVQYKEQIKGFSLIKGTGNRQ